MKPSRMEWTLPGETDFNNLRLIREDDGKEVTWEIVKAHNRLPDLTADELVWLGRVVLESQKLPTEGK